MTAMLESLLKHNKEEIEYLLALVISENRIDAALWEKNHQGARVLKTSQAAYEGTWEKAIDAADSAISDIESALPENASLKKTVFGLFPRYLTDDHIKDNHLKELKQLTSALSLTPVGFVDTPTAISHALTRDENTQQTVVLIGLEERHMTVSLFKIGKLVESVTVPRSSMPSTDVEKALQHFTNVEVLPSRMLLYGTASDLEGIKNDMLSYPWAEKANFLHFPKIEILPDDYLVKAVVAASATELTPHQEAEVETPAVVPSTTPTPNEPAEPPPETAVAEAVRAPHTTTAKDLGFTPDEQTQEDEYVSMDEETAHENVAPPPPAPTKPRFATRLPQLPRFSFALPNFSGGNLSFRLPVVPRIGLVIGLVVLLLLLVGGGVAGAWFLPKATVRILVQPQTFDKTEELTVDTNASVLDIEKKVLPGTIVETDISGTETVPATGEKIVGDRAQGEVTVFNKTLNTKNFSKGTVLTSGNLEFTLDDDVTVASASESLSSLTYGSSKAQVTASDIGTASNLPANSDFSFEGLPTTSYTARNENALSGGTSREITVVSRADQTEAQEAVTVELTDKAAQELMNTLDPAQKLLDNSLTTEVTEESYSHEIGEEATELTANITLAITAAVYNAEDMDTLLEDIVKAQISEDYEYRPQDRSIEITDITEDDGVWTFKPHISVKLLPKIDTSSFSEKLAGRSQAEASEYLQSQSSVAGVEYDVHSALPFFGNRLPFNAHNITIELEAL